MSIVLAHQKSSSHQLALEEAAKQAQLRKTSLLVVHVPEGVDVDVNEEQRSRLREEIAEALPKIGMTEVPWALQVATGEDVADTILDVVAGADAELLVIGARRRSPVGKLFMGSVTQKLILRADIPVLVVKASNGKS
jgi:nucleotide-binding universal stress UspA family protein